MIKLFKKDFFIYFYTIFLGGVSSFSLPPYNYFIINFFTLSLLFIFIINQNKYQKKIKFFLQGWFFGFGYFLCSLYWISIALTFDENFKILIPISIVIVPAYLAIFYGIAVYIFSFFLKNDNISLIIIFSIIFGVVEFLRGNMFSGFPWNLFAYSFSENLRFIQVLSIIGTYGFNMICITFFLSPTILIFKRTKSEIFTFLSIFFLALSFLFYGNKNLEENKSIKLGDDNYTIKIISSKIAIDRFYDEFNEKKILEEMIEISSPDLKQQTIFIWPEGVFTSSSLNQLKKYKNIFNNNFSKKHIIILGINDVLSISGKEEIYNSLVVTDNNLNIKNIYHKNKLVPFGEFLPFENFLQIFGLESVIHHYNSFSEGTKRDVIDIRNNYFDLNFLPLICYEIIYSGSLSNHSEFDFIINISEDGWFGNSIGPYQHFSHLIFRSIEEGKPIIRSANNGISAFIDSNGRILKKLESTKSGFIEINNKFKSKNTVFSRYYNKMFFILLIIYISFLFFINLTKRK